MTNAHAEQLRQASVPGFERFCANVACDRLESLGFKPNVEPTTSVLRLLFIAFMAGRQDASAPPAAAPGEVERDK